MRNFLLSLKYARRELRAGLKGFYVFLSCLVLGTGAVAGVQSLSQGMLDSLRNDGRFILGGDIALRTVYQPATPDQLRFLKKEVGVVNTVMETRAMARAKGTDQSMLVELKAVDPFYPMYGWLEFEDADGNVFSARGKMQDFILPVEGFDRDGAALSPWGAMVEKEVLARLGLEIGDTISIGSKDFEIRAVLVREPDRLSGRGFTFAPRVMISYYVFEETGLREQGSQVYYDHRVLAPYARTPTALSHVVDFIQAKYPDAEWRIRTAYNAAPRMERMIRRLTQFLTLIGLATLLVGGVGISSAVRSFLEGKIANIATLKCLGAPAAFVRRVYMSMVLMLAALGVALGLGAGVAASHLAGALLTEKLSLTNKVGFYPLALLYAAAFGFLISFCFSLWPVARAADARPNDLFRSFVQPARRRVDFNSALWIVIAAQAMALLAVMMSYDRVLSVWFAGGAAAVFCVFHGYAAVIKAALRRARIPARPEWRMAFANLYRPGNITAGVVLSLGIGLTVLIAVAMVEDNFSRLLEKDIAAQTPSFFFLDIQPDQREAFGALLLSRPTARDLVMAPLFNGRIVAVNGVPAEEALADKSESWVIQPDRRFTWLRDRPATGEIVAGEWWPPDYDGPPLVSIATDVADAFGIGPGAKMTVRIFGADMEVEVASVRDVEWKSMAMNFAVTFSPGLLEKVPSNYVATVVMDEAHEMDAQMAVARDFPNVTTVRVRDALETVGTAIRAGAQAVSISAGVTLLAGVLVLAGGIAAARRRHVYDSIVLKVLGATRGRILRTFLYEYGLLGMLTVLISAALGTISAWAVLVHVMEMKWRFSPLALVLVALLSLSITVLAGFAGTWRALLQKPAPWLRNP